MRGRYLGRFWTKISGSLHGRPFFIPMNKYEPIGSLEILFHCQNPIFGLFRALFGRPKADIHSANILMVIYHVFEVIHIHWTTSQRQKVNAPPPPPLFESSDHWRARLPCSTIIFKVLFSEHVQVSICSRLTGSNFFREEAATKKAPRQFKWGE